ncbi:MAG: AI-2E family transporter [Planctomycetaceae bacterium]
MNAVAAVRDPNLAAPPQQDRPVDATQLCAAEPVGGAPIKAERPADGNDSATSAEPCGQRLAPDDGGVPGLTQQQACPADQIGHSASKSGPVDGRWALRILTTLACLSAAYVARSVMVPVVFALLLTLTLRPIVRQLKRRGMPVSFGSALVIAILVLLLLAGVTNLVGPAKDWIDNAPRDLRIVGKRLSPVWSRWKQIENTSKELENIGEPVNSGADGNAITPQNVPVKVEVTPPRLEANLLILNSASGVLTEVTVALVLTFFLLMSSDVLINNILRLLESTREKRKTVELVYSVEQGISSYLLAVTLINVGLGFAEGIAMWLLGMPNPALWGVMCCVLNFIPYLGATVSGIVLFLVAVLTFPNLERAMLVPIVAFAINAVEGNFITPAVLGKSMELNPVMVFLFLTFWAWMWGIPGAILAVPILTVLKIGFEHFESTRLVGSLLGG